MSVLGIIHAVCRNTYEASVLADSPPLPLPSGESVLSSLVKMARTGWHGGGGCVYHPSFGACKLPVVDSPPLPSTATSGRGTACLGTEIKVWLLMTLSYALNLATAAVAAAVAEFGVGPAHVRGASMGSITGDCLGGGFVKYGASVTLVLDDALPRIYPKIGGGALGGVFPSALGSDMMTGMQGRVKRVLRLILVCLDWTRLCSCLTMYTLLRTCQTREELVNALIKCQCVFHQWGYAEQHPMRTLSLTHTTHGG